LCLGFLALAVLASAQQPMLHMINVEGDETASPTLTITQVNTTTGEQMHEKQFGLPPASCHGGLWRLSSASPSTSTSFYTNMTLFFAAEMLCPPLLKLVNTTIFSVMPFVPKAWVKGVFPPTPIAETQIAWDFSCNIIVVLPEIPKVAPQPEIDYVALEVSDYDGQQRPLPSQGKFSPGGLLQRVPLGGALAAQDMWADERVGPAPNELNCGDQCYLFHVERNISAVGEPRQMGKLVGRSVRHGNVSYSVNDTTQLLSLVFFPGASYPEERKAMFYGLGVCCDDAAWCPASCKGEHGSLSIVAYNISHHGAAPEVVHVFSGTDGAPSSDTSRLGLTVDYMSGRLTVLVDGDVVTFQTKPTSPKLVAIDKAPLKAVGSATPLHWAYMGM